LKTMGFHLSEQPSLPMPDIRKQRGQPVGVPFEFWPIFELMDVFHNHRSSCGD